MKRFAILTALALAACSQSDTGATEGGDSIAACTARGIAYFKEIGSYPTLSSAPNAGRLASEVAAERCRRTLTAF